MRYEYKRLDVLGAVYPYHPHHNVRHVAVKDAILGCGVDEVLVLGCGKGIVEYLLPDGFRCVSLDISPNEIEAARQINRYKANREFHVSDVFQSEKTLGNRKFPAVAISEVIEHLEQDRLALEVARQHLLPAGWLILTVPNTNRFHNWLLRLFGRQAFLMTREHVREYTVRAVSALLASVGFSIVRWRGVWFDFPRPFRMEMYISPYSSVRTTMAALFPRWATYLLFTCKLGEARHEGLGSQEK